MYRIDAGHAVIQTVDFITPIVDDPYDFGAIAAANSVSDVYAMGGRVILALNVCGFPKSMDEDVIGGILRGGAETVKEAGGVIAGGHTVDDKEPKYGLAVTGVVHPDRVLTKTGARPGDLLVLTKPLGVGVVTTAFKGNKADDNDVAEAVKQMKLLNKTSSEVFSRVGAHGCTDITGFSLLGHGYEITEKSGCAMTIRVKDLPFTPGAVGYADESLFPGGSHRNRHYYGKWVTFERTVSEKTQLLLFSPETSGGLLGVIPEENMDSTAALLEERKQPFWIIGEITEGRGITVKGI